MLVIQLSLSMLVTLACARDTCLGLTCCRHYMTAWRPAQCLHGYELYVAHMMLAIESAWIATCCLCPGAVPSGPASGSLSSASLPGYPCFSVSVCAERLPALQSSTEQWVCILPAQLQQCTGFWSLHSFCAAILQRCICTGTCLLSGCFAEQH